MKQITSFRDVGLSGSSYRDSSVASLQIGRFDVALHCSSWDKRAVAIAASESLWARHGLLVLPSLRDRDGLRQVHDQILKDFCFARYSSTLIIEEDSTKLATVWNRLFESLLETRLSVGRPLSVLIDLSTCPRYFSLAAIGLCLGEGLARSVTCFYSEGAYPIGPQNVTGEEELTFTFGQWDTVSIPFLQGEYDPLKGRYYLVSVGFEGWKTMRVVSRADPDRVSILFPSPGVTSGYVKRAKAANDKLISQFQVPSNQIVRAHAADAIGAWRKLADAKCERPSSENTYFLCSGTKPHSLALALRSLTARQATVLYNCPEKHVPVAIEPNGTFWKFDIENLFVPRAFSTS